MGNDDELKILIETALDFEKSLTTMTAQMNQLRDRFKNYKLQITAGLDRTASNAQVKADLQKIKVGKSPLKVGIQNKLRRMSLRP